jgi:hypothetical protein
MNKAHRSSAGAPGGEFDHVADVVASIINGRVGAGLKF